jgi:hypothetical protein
MLILATKTQSPPPTSDRWIYLGEDFTDMLRWRKVLGHSRQISYSHRIEPMTEKLTVPFLQWTSKEAERNPGKLEWWMTRLAGHNVMSTPIFLHFCYLEILWDIVESLSGNESLTAICEDLFLLRTVAKNFKARGCKVILHRSGLVSLLDTAVRQAFGIAARWALHGSRFVGALLASRLTRNPLRQCNKESKIALIHTFIDEGCFQGKDGFQDRYFPGLAEWLRSQGYRVKILPWIYKINRSIFSAYRFLRNCREDFVILEDHVRLHDLPIAVIRSIQTAYFPKGLNTFRGWDVFPLILREKLATLGMANLFRFFTYGPALKRWLARNNCEIFIDVFENMFPEKPAIQAFRTFSPGTFLVGYAHSMGPPDLLNTRVTTTEWQTGLFPDVIVANGSRTVKNLELGDIPRKKLREGPALRSSDVALVSSPSSDRDFSERRKKVLVAMPIGVPASVEILTHLLSLQSTLTRLGLQIWLKHHPMTAPEKIMDGIDQKVLPSGWEWAEKPLGNYLSQVGLVIGNGTSALIDAVAAGIPIITLGRELGLSFNTLAWWGNEYSECRTVDPSELEDRLLQIYQENGPTPNNALASEVKNAIGKVDNWHLSAFLPDGFHD